MPAFPSSVADQELAVLAFLRRAPNGATTNMLLNAIDEASPDDIDDEVAVGTITDMVLRKELVVRDGRLFAAKRPRRSTSNQCPQRGDANNPCLCGCGRQTARRFAPGHDAKLHSLAVRIHQGKADKDQLPTTDATLAYLRSAPWMTDEIAQSLGLA